MSDDMSNEMAEVAVAAPNPASYQATYWLALALTPGLGPTRIKKLIEHYGTAERVFHASLTELEATGMRAVSAQSLATGKSLELAQQECVKAVEAGAKIISLSDPEYPARLKEIYDPPVILFVKGSIECWPSPASRWWERVIPRPTAAAWPNAFPPTSPLAAW
jgi:predicted Rossmann fold nucleotide-binding protein DprA/Smf involved in DNA uptake